MWAEVLSEDPEHGQGGVARHQTRGVSTPAQSRGPPVRQAPSEQQRRGAGAARPLSVRSRGRISVHWEVFIGRTDAEAEAPIFWLPDVKN